MQRPTHPRGFSLTELLIVVGIIGLLLGMLFPVAGAIRQRMKLVACGNNLRQIGAFLGMYYSDHRRWPDATFVPPPYEVLNPEGFAAVCVPLSPYLPPGSGIYRCPADTVLWPQTAAASPKGLGISYTYIRDEYRKDPRFGGSFSTLVMSDPAFGNSKGVLLPPHPGHVINRLLTDGSVDQYAVQ